MNLKNSISAIVIARNEAARIKRCLIGLSWAYQILVIDNGSTDETATIARKNHAIVLDTKTHDFSEIRTVGANHAEGEWLFYVDADEIVTPSLRDEILDVTRDQKRFEAFFITRKNYYLGFAWPSRDGMVRLIRKKSFIGWDGILHEHAVIKGTVGKLRNYFIHDTHRTLEEMVSKTNEWSAYEAKLRLDNHHPVISPPRILRVMITAFCDSFIKQGGWKAGTIGWIESIYQAFSLFITYAKLWEMQKKKI